MLSRLSRRRAVAALLGRGRTTTCARRAMSDTPRRRSRDVCGCYSIAFPPSASKDRVLSAVSEALEKTQKKQAGSPNAAVLLVSGKLAPWIEDDGFVSSMLEPLVRGTTDDVHVLSAAVDGVPHLAAREHAGSGLSVLYGRLDSLLPGMWADAGPTGSARPSVQVQMALAGEGHGVLPLEVTVPLANTVFDNGRSHAMFASRWGRASRGGALQLMQLAEKRNQVIVPAAGTSSRSAGPSALCVPLVPITPPRKIVDGLGNILRRVEVDGRPQPASKELEAIVPRLLQERAAALGSTEPGPIGVWALVVPEFAASYGLLEVLEAGNVRGHTSWVDAGFLSPQAVRQGWQLRRILSGGGGWGLKQGLLSLDPETRYAERGQEDVESFIRSFKGEAKASGSDPVAPGSFVQFFVSPLTPPDNQVRAVFSREGGLGQTVVLGTLGNSTEKGGGAVGDEIEVHMDCFGAFSAQGIYLASGVGNGTDEPTLCSRIDVPNSFIGSRF